MKVERKNNEIVVRFSAGTKASRIQSILDYLRYEELTSKSEATEKDIETLTKNSKSDRWEKIKKECSFKKTNVKHNLLIALLLSTQAFFSQNFLNLDFESVVEGTDSPSGWYIGNPPYKAVIDTNIRFKSTNSLRFETDFTDENSFGMCSITFPADLAKGKTIEFKGRIKTKDVKNGYAGLWLSASNDEGTQAFDNMGGRGLVGTNDWSEVSIKLSIDTTVTSINLGGLFTGEGTVWFDNFEIFLDDKKFEDVEPKRRMPTKEELTWLKQQVKPLRSFYPSTDSNDLKILDELIGDSQIVGLGETTHGSSEIFKMKHRIVKYLAENKNFDIFSIEANAREL